MLQPLAIVFYERVMPGSQLVNRLQDMSYRVLAVGSPAQFVDAVQRECPLLAFIDLEARGDVCGAIQQVKSGEATSHVPVVAFAPDNKTNLQDAAQKAGANLIVGESRLGNQLPQLVEQALAVD